MPRRRTQRGAWWLVMLCMAGCTAHFERPVLAVSGVQLQRGANLLQQSFLVTFQVENPNDRPLPVTAVHADLTVGGDRIASGATNRAFVVPPRGQSTFDMTINANMALAILKLASSPHADSIDYEVTGAADLDLPFMHNLPFHQTGSFSLRAPQ
ncbi:MAG TPA: LEA type 2 family protein [Steroidobacteraceae bacterium]|nr:LEA type 2 family protein [Steroidobacteraceae bacterium]